MSLNPASRALWLIIGLSSLGCGILGVVLPLLPTTPFILVSVFAFARSSPRLHDWLISHQRFGPLITNWQRHGAIDRRTKYIALTVMVLTPPISWLMGVPLWIILVQICVLSLSATFIITRPEQ